ncbi:methylmalonyl-CoA mutase C-terminal domain-containing protein/methyltransferase cognate corrinoid proteins [Prevotella sp. tf2-5]|nr:homocysteine S-methyltransferase family protein [Prevotella sp. tf2-5]SFO66348.1 methylmalonyl-CoA mutase C-terminal domain-containing protein/methyltransferase cognate corrinoid proteins [Prevotella sp. tf2-5]
MNTWKPNLEETKKRYINWWNHKGIILNMWEHFQEGVKPHADIPMPPTPRDLNQKWFDPEWRADYLDWYVAHSSLMADMLPVANTQLGPGSLAAILGGVFEGGEDTIWIHPNPNYSDDIVFNPNHPNYLLHKDLLKACKRKAQGHYYVGMPDLMEGLDVLAAIKGTDQVLLDTVMQPEMLEHQMQQINDIYFQVFDELYDIIREGDEMAFCYFSSWAPGKMSKLQSDISTMISVDDYRRFVQPFIREQCQKIDYTLYHLDGVGAMHHLDALLEIKELNAIQWTPGVGEPQGGSPKWYDLYKKILAHGKSIMACWVTLDELRPLLDNIGGDGVHLEMDFHNEQEVEQAIRIIEEYQSHDEVDDEVREIIRLIESPDESVKHPRSEFPTDRVLVLDGAMGTMIQQYQLREEDFRGARFANHTYDLKGCNDILSLTCPFVIRDIHRKYLEAGADIIETNTFNAQRISMGDFGMQDYCREINLAAVKIARETADQYSTPEKPRYVVGSIGPTSRTTSVATSGIPLPKEQLGEAYEEQIKALRDGGVDGLLIETIFDVENARIAIEAAKRIAPDLPLMLSFSVTTPDGHNMMGQSILEFLEGLDVKPYSIGINCLSDVQQMTPLVCQLAQFGTKVSLYPNAGMPDAKGQYNKTPQALLADIWQLLENHCLNIIGGCCGTTDAHIRLMAQAVEPVKGLYLSPLTPGNDPGLSGISSSPSIPNSSNFPSSPSEVVLSSEERLFQAILNGKSEDAATATREAMAQNIAPQDLINGQMIRAMSEVGRRFQDGKAFVPQLLMAGRAMKAALEILKPMMAGTANTTLGKVVIGTVKGDLHDIGKNLVASMLEGCGFEVVNIGIDVSADTFIQAVKDNQPDILCMSALLTTTMGYMKEVIDALEAAGIREQVKVMVGGAPVTQGFADEIGADGYSDNANSAVTVAKQLLGKL